MSSKVPSLLKTAKPSARKLMPSSRTPREQFTDYLNDPLNKQNANGVTWQTVKMMNAQMVRDGVHMTAEHLDVARTSIGRGDNICKFLQAENLHVVESEGQGATYQAGKLLHQTIHGLSQPCPLQKWMGEGTKTEIE
jgi:hypothetical protein